jgi:hypothetical protein
MKSPMFIALLLIILSFELSAQSLGGVMEKGQQQTTDQAGAPASEVANTDPFAPLGFTGSYRIELRTYHNGVEQAESPAAIGMAFTPERMVLIPRQKEPDQEVRVLVDLRNKHLYTIITDAKGTKIGLKTTMVRHTAEDEKSSTEAPTLEHTTTTREINGYTCHKIIYTTGEGIGEAWVAEEFDFDTMDALAHLSGGQKMQQWQMMEVKGLIMENKWASADGKEVVEMFVRDLVVGKVDASLFDTSGIEIRDLTSVSTTEK